VGWLKRVFVSLLPVHVDHHLHAAFGIELQDQVVAKSRTRRAVGIDANAVRALIMLLSPSSDEVAFASNR